MGMGFGSKELDFEAFDNGDPIKLEFQTSTAVQAEGAYFINKYVGLGGRLRVKTSPIKGWEDFMGMAENDAKEAMDDIKDIEKEFKHDGIVGGSLDDMLQDKEFTIESDHLTEFAADAGLYFNIPLSRRFSLGTKLLVGRSIMQELDLNARYSGMVKDLQYDMIIVNGTPVDININSFSTMKNADGSDMSYDEEWDYLTVSANNSTKWGTGISLTYAYKKNFSWKVFCDYDYTRKNYTLTYDPDYYVQFAMPEAIGMAALLGLPYQPEKHTIKKHVNSWIVGASFAVSF